MGKIIGVRFTPSGKSYDFDSGAFVVTVGDQVIVETEQGLGFGSVSRPPRPLPESPAADPLKKIYRMATEEDLAQHEKNLALEEEAIEHCKECIATLGLPMRLFSVESTFDNSKMTFYFTSEGRVDFRELVKMLVRHFRMRIELRQIGVRHQAKMCGGLGRCGREACCTTFLANFVPVSVKMAKVQNLSLNPTKISGLCGRLMCCLTYEYESYQEMRRDFPKIGKLVDTSQGRGKVVRHNVIKGLVSVRLGNSETEFPVEEVERADPDSPPPVMAPVREKGPPPRHRERPRPRPRLQEAGETAPAPPALAKALEPGGNDREKTREESARTQEEGVAPQEAAVAPQEAAVVPQEAAVAPQEAAAGTQDAADRPKRSRKNRRKRPRKRSGNSPQGGGAPDGNASGGETPG
ncbi:MAG: stage 0 sporulation family protein [Pseudomonadota bacterium]